MSTVGVLQLIDSLDPGGAESMAVNLANHLPSEHFRSYLCATRHTGGLISRLNPAVQLLDLGRRGRFDVSAVFRLASFITRNRIGLLHAHSTSAFLAAAAMTFAPGPKLIWHDHFGMNEACERSVRLYRALATRVSGILAVNQKLAAWARIRLRFPQDRVWILQNFVPAASPGPANEIPGRPGFRIVHLANFRPQKDHQSLLEAMSRIVREVPDAHLCLVGSEVDTGLSARLHEDVAAFGLARRVSWLGQRSDVAAVLAACDIGVLSSVSEGLPLALLDYGMASLPVVSTDVGDCREVLDNGAAGVLVPPRNPDALATALIELLRSETKRKELGANLFGRVQERYSPRAAMGKLCEIYAQVLATS